jgi:hypothetical protein
MLSNWAIKQLEHLTLDYLKLDCAGGKCYGILAVRKDHIGWFATWHCHMLTLCCTTRSIECALHLFFFMLSLVSSSLVFMTVVKNVLHYRMGKFGIKGIYIYFPLLPFMTGFLT